MISKPPKTGNPEFDAWALETQYLINNAIKTLDIPVSKSGIISNYVHGKHPTKLMVAGDSGYFGFIIPTELAKVKEATIRFIPTTTGSIDYTVNLSYGGVDEDENTSTATTGAVTGLTVTDDQITEIDITALFASVDGDDQIGCQFTLDALTTTTDIQVLSLYLKYI